MTGLHSDFVVAVGALPGSRYVTASRDKTIRLWSQSHHQGEINLPIPPDTSASSITISPNGKLIASALLDCSIAIHDVQTGLLIRHLKCHTSGVSKIVFSTNKTLILGTTDGHITLISL